jgi:hypothetical protein
MRCKCCDAILPASRMVHSYLIPDPNNPKKKITAYREDDLCRRCTNAATPENYLGNTAYQEDDITSLGLDLPIESSFYDYYEN